MIEIDMDLNTVEFRQQLPTENGISPKQYGQYIVGDYNIESGKTRVVVNTVVLSQAPMLFDERNPSFNFKEVTSRWNQIRSRKSRSYLYNVDPPTIKNVLQKVKLYGPDVTDGKVISTTVGEMNIVPSFLMNAVVVDDTGAGAGIGDLTNSLGSGLNNNKANAEYYGHSIAKLRAKASPDEEVANNVYEPILRKLLGWCLYSI